MPNGYLTASQIQALGEMAACWGPENFALIGAHALACHLPFDWRGTGDLDVTVHTSIEGYPAGLEQLPGWTHSDHVPHRWLAPNGVPVDVLPMSREILDSGGLKLPGDTRVVSMVGMRLALTLAEPVEIAPTLDVRVPLLEVLLVLKMAAYLDRPADRKRDLQDFFHVLRHYPAIDDDRRYSNRVLELGLQAGHVGAYLVGAQVGSLDLLPDELAIVDQFAAKMETDDAVRATMAREIGSMADVDEVSPFVDAYRLGLNG